MVGRRRKYSIVFEKASTHTLPPAGGMGKPGFPIPSQTFPRAGAGGAGRRPAGVAMALILAMTRQVRRSYLV